MKSPIKYLIFLLLAFSPLLVQGHGNELPSEVSIAYTVTRSNEATNVWFSEDFSQSWNYTILENSEIVVNVTDVYDEQTTLDLQVGNLVRESINDIETEDNIGNGYWYLGRTLGFIANTSWSTTQTAFNNLDSINPNFNTTTSFFSADQFLPVLGESIAVIVMHINDGFQTSTLTYSQAGHFLVSLDSTISGFDLAFELTSIDGDPNYFLDEEDDDQSDNEISFNLVFGLVSFTIVIYVAKKSKNTYT